MEKKRVDVKETRNLAKNKGREKKEGRKTLILTTHRHCHHRESGAATAKIRVRDFSSDRRQRHPAFVG